MIGITSIWLVLRSCEMLRVLLQVPYGRWAPLGASCSGAVTPRALGAVVGPRYETAANLHGCNAPNICSASITTIYSSLAAIY